MSDLSRRSSRQPLLPADDTNSLTSFPDPAESTSPSLPPEAEPQPEPQLNGLLDATGPSMFDEQDGPASEPQTLSVAPNEVIQNVIDHRGAVEVVRHLSALLAERDAHVTALTRLAQEYKIPADRIFETSQRVKQAERRRLSIAAAASEDLAPTTVSEGSSSAVADSIPDTNGTFRGLTKLFGGTGKRQASGLRPPGSTRDDASSRSTSRAPPAKDRPRSVDVQSVGSTESGGWATALFSGGTTIKASLTGTVKKRDTRPVREPVEMSTRHDKDQLPPTLSQPTKDPQEAEWNKFLVKLMKAREQAGVDARSGELIGASRFGNEGNAGRNKLESLTRLVIGGIPMNLRHPIWMELSDTYAIMRPDAYQYYLHLPKNDDLREMDAILKDVPRTLTSKYDFYADKGHDRLKRVLVAFVSKYPGLGYTQGLNMIAGYLLLAIPDESDAFWVLCNMVDEFFPRDYFSREGALAAPIADNVVLRQYVKELLPKLSDKMDEYDVDAEHTVPLSWFLTAFASVLAESVLLRIWDVWLCLSNQKAFLFNIALTLLTQHAKALVECESQGEFFAYMSSQCTVPEEPERLNEFIRQAFFMRKKLEQVEIRRALAMKRPRKHASTEALYAPEPEVEAGGLA